MGSHSDWETMREACIALDQFKIPYKKEIVSAHRTPDLLYQFAKSAKENNIKTIIAGAGGSAHLPGMIASLTTLPVLGVPIFTKNLQGVDSLYSIVQMPKGIPVGTLAIGGAWNAAILALQILALEDLDLAHALEKYRLDLQNEALSKNTDLNL